MRRRRLLPVLPLLAMACTALPAPQAPAAGAEAAPIEATSLLGRPLHRPAQSPEFRQRQEELLAAVRAALAERPGDVEQLIWEGRRTAYLGRYREAIALFDRAIAAHPDDPRLYRHRGHRAITTRRLAAAIADLERAAELAAGRPDEVEPDGLPNPAGIPTSTLKSNIWYHLGLARYLCGDYAGAAADGERCADAATTSDMFVACSYWRYLALRRSGRQRQAQRVLGSVSNELELLENHSYHRLLLMFKGHLGAAEMLDAARGQDGIGQATVAYGVGAWHLLEGDAGRARQVFEEIVAAPDWPAFGHIAAEAELAGPRCDGAAPPAAR